MSIKIELECCEGHEEYPGHCLKRKCPIYRVALSEVDRSWPKLPTGFGNAYGNPSHSHYLAEVRDLLRKRADDVADDLKPI